MLTVLAVTLGALAAVSWARPPPRVPGGPGSAAQHGSTSPPSQWRMRPRRTGSAHAAAHEALLVEALQTMVSELRSGSPPADALRGAAAVAPETLGPAARAAGWGGDPGPVLRATAATSHADALGALAAAWDVCLRSGAPLAEVLDDVVAALRAEQQTRAEVAAQLTPVVATARLMAVLPVGVCLLATGAGLSPLPVLFSPIGVALLSGGGVLAATGLLWVRALAHAAMRPTG